MKQATRDAKNLTKAAEMAIEIETRDILADCKYFIRNYVYIEDKENIEGISKFNMWPEQERALRTILKEQFTIILKSRQLGLTWLVLAIIVWYMLNTKKFLAIFISKRDEPDTKEVSLRVQLILKYLPKWLIQEKSKAPVNWTGFTYEANNHLVEIFRPDGESSRLMLLAASPDTAHSFTANLVAMDEWALHPSAEEIWTGAFPTMNRPGYSGKVIGLSTGRRNTLFERIWNNTSKGVGRFKKIFLNWRADIRRNDEWYQKTKEDFPTSYKQQYPEKESDAFAVGEGAFFEEWDENVHVPVAHWEPENNRRWPIIGAYDPGFSSNAVFKWYAVSPDGWARAFREYYPHRVTDKDQAEEIVKRSFYADGSAMEFYYIVADSDAWSPSRSNGKSTAAEFADHGLAMREADKKLSNGWRQLHEWLKPFVGSDGKTKTALLTFTRDCANTIRTYPSCEQSKTNPEDIALSSEHHPQDIDRYFVMSRPMPFSEESREERGSFDEDNQKGRTSQYSPYD